MIFLGQNQKQGDGVLFLYVIYGNKEIIRKESSIFWESLKVYQIDWNAPQLANPYQKDTFSFIFINIQFL